jgi:hypothetical protein
MDEEQLTAFTRTLANEVIKQYNATHVDAPQFSAVERRNVRNMMAWYNAEMKMKGQKLELQAARIAFWRKLGGWTFKGGLVALGGWMSSHVLETLWKILR